MCVVEFDEGLNIVDVNVFFDPMDLFRQLDEAASEGTVARDVAVAAQGACPFMGQFS